MICSIVPATKLNLNRFYKTLFYAHKKEFCKTLSTVDFVQLNLAFVVESSLKWVGFYKRQNKGIFLNK